MTEAHQEMKASAVLVSVVAAIGGFLFGYDTAVINGAVDAIREEFRISSATTGLVVSCALVGSALGAALAGRVADRFGRVRLMLTAAALFTVSALGSGLAFGVADLIFWRFIGGVGIGAASVAGPMYIAEVAPARLRGRLGSLQQLAIVLGIFASLMTDAFLASAAGGANQPLWLRLDAWRWMFLSALVPSLAYWLLAKPLPESPRFLVARGQPDRALTVLRRFLVPDDAASTLSAIRNSLGSELRPSLRDLRGPTLGLAPIVWVGILLSVFQQFVGINVIFYYSTSLWRSVGFSEADALTVTVITSVTNVLVTLVAISLVDRLGRRPLLLIGSAGMTLTLAAMAVCFTYAHSTPSGVSLPPPFSTVALLAANAYVVFFGVSWGPVVWVLLAEIFPNRMRGSGLALAASVQWIANFLVSTSFPVLAQALGLGVTYAIYAGFAGLSLLFVWGRVPETKGKELEEMTG